MYFMAKSCMHTCTVRPPELDQNMAHLSPISLASIIFRENRDSADKCIFRSSAQNSAFRGKLWSLIIMQYNINVNCLVQWFEMWWAESWALFCSIRIALAGCCNWRCVWLMLDFITVNPDCLDVSQASPVVYCHSSLCHNCHWIWTRKQLFH